MMYNFSQQNETILWCISKEKVRLRIAICESSQICIQTRIWRLYVDVFCSYVNRTLLFVTIFFSEIKHFFQVSRGRKGPKSLEHHAFAKNFILLSLLVEIKDRVHVVTFTYRE